MEKNLLHQFGLFMRTSLIFLICTFATHAGNSQSTPEPSSSMPTPLKMQSPPSQDIPPQTPNMTINNNNYPTVHVHNSNQGTLACAVNATAQSSSNAYAQAKNYMKNNIEMMQASCMSMIPESILKNAPGALIHLRAHSKWYVFATGYASICTALIAGNHYINHDRRWARWKKELSMADFYTQTHKQIANDLIHEIQRRYLNPKNPTDFLTPLITFVQVIDCEVNRINWYIRLATLISWCHLTMIFPINEAKLEQARRAQERLHFIKHIFVSWAGEYNIGQAMHTGL